MSRSSLKRQTTMETNEASGTIDKSLNTELLSAAQEDVKVFTLKANHKWETNEPFLIYKT